MAQPAHKLLRPRSQTWPKGSIAASHRPQGRPGWLEYTIVEGIPILRVPYYGLFDRYTNTFRLFQLVGPRSQEIHLTERQFWFEEMKLGLGVWQGQYQETEGFWRRWYQENGDWVPTPEERAEQESQRAEQERQRAERLAAQLRALGIDPD